MGYEIEIVERQPEVTAAVVGRVPHDGVGPFIGEALGEVLAVVGEEAVTGMPFCRIDLDGDGFLLEVGFPVAGPVEPIRSCRAVAAAGRRDGHRHERRTLRQRSAGLLRDRAVDVGERLQRRGSAVGVVPRRPGGAAAAHARVLALQPVTPRSRRRPHGRNQPPPAATVAGMQWHRGALVHLSGSPDLAGAADALRLHADGGLLVADDGTIAWSGPWGERPVDDAPVIDHHGAFLLPGFVDTHLHFPQVHCVDGFGGGTAPAVAGAGGLPRRGSTRGPRSRASVRRAVLLPSRRRRHHDIAGVRVAVPRRAGGARRARRSRSACAWCSVERS